MENVVLEFRELDCEGFDEAFTGFSKGLMRYKG